MWSGGALAKVPLEWSPLSLLGPLSPFPTAALPALSLIRTSAIGYSRSGLLAIRAKRAILSLPCRVYKT
jgi:hypothetical protein